MRRNFEVARGAQVSVVSGAFRTMTNTTQFNPLHDFSARQGVPHATDSKQFYNMIVNPGPLRILYSPDYLDWYYKAYNNRVKFERDREAQEQKHNGATVDGAQSRSPGLSNKSLRPASSLRRVAGEARKAKAQREITNAAVQHGLFDAFERQPQFPNIHIDKCSDEHILSIFNEMILPSAFSSEELWEKALMYRALLVVRKTSYPESFNYMKTFANDVALSAPDSHEDVRSVLPGKNAADYFEFLVRKYHIENANEAAVVLHCHRLTDANKLLFSNPPPSSDAEEVKLPQSESYPSLSALSDESNMSLLRCLIFGEFNFMVSADPFAKYPGAASTVLRPKSESTLSVRANPNATISAAVANRRGSLTAALTNNISSNLDARGQDVLRSQQNHAMADNFFNRELSRRLEAEPGLYATDRTQYNPRATRAEERDYTSRQLLEALKAYDAADTSFVHRESNDTYAASRDNGATPGLMGNVSVLPTVAHFTNLLLSDIHISFCVAALPLEKSNRIRQHVVDTAEVLYTIAREYTVETQRQLLTQKMKVVASLLDFEVTSSLSSLASDAICGPTARQLGSYIPFATRKLDEMGRTTTARVDDYNRWMRPLTKASL